MKYQAKPYYCGPAAIQNAMRLLGRSRPPSQKHLAELCGTTKDGTDEFGIMRGLRGCGLGFMEYWADIPKRLFSGVWLLCTDNWKHWVTVGSSVKLDPSGRADYLYLLVDPERTKSNISQNGVHVLSWASLKRRWACAFKSENREAGQPAYYAIEVLG